MHTDTPDLPRGVVIHRRRRDLTEELTVGLPFLDLERSIYDQFVRYRNLATFDTSERVELRDYVQLRRGLPLQRDSDCLLLETLRSEKSALGSILPCTNDQMQNTGKSILNNLNGVYISDVHRGVLCALGNNRAGLGGLSSNQLYSILRQVSSGEVVKYFLSVPGYMRQSMAQQLLRISIEAGNVRFVDAMLSNEVLQIDINEQICKVEGQHYSPLERASMLRHLDMIEIMLNHGADVHKTFSCIHTQNVITCGNCKSKGALHCALLHGPRNHRLDSRIFNLLLERSDRINFETLEILMRQREDDFLLEVLEKFAHTSHKEWQVQKRFGCIWTEVIRSLKQETKVMIVLQIMERLEVAKNTRMLNAAAQNGHATVVEKMFAYGIDIDRYTLCSAIESENAELVCDLLDYRGATVNDSCIYADGDPFSTAVRTGNDSITQILIEHKAMERLDQWDPWLAAWKAAVKVGNRGLL
jgi:hypothetical protein